MPLQKQWNELLTSAAPYGLSPVLTAWYILNGNTDQNCTTKCGKTATLFQRLLEKRAL